MPAAPKALEDCPQRGRLNQIAILATQKKTLHTHSVRALVSSCSSRKHACIAPLRAGTMTSDASGGARSTKKRRLDHVTEVLEAAKNELDEREQTLEHRERALQQALDGVSHEKKLMAGRKPTDVLPLNVGGVKTWVSRRTLCLYEPSLLAAQFSGRWDDNVEKDADGNFFVDQPYELFKPLLDFLRAKAIATPARPGPAHPSILMLDGQRSFLEDDSGFLQLVDHYGMMPFVYSQRLSVWRGDASTEVLNANMELKATAMDWGAVRMENVHSDRNLIVKNYTVLLDSQPTTRSQIGWASDTGFPSKQSCGDANAKKGVGEQGTSVALDLSRGGICYNGAVVVAIHDLSVEVGSTVTSKYDGISFSWFVAGAEIATVKKSSLEKWGWGDTRPAFSGAACQWRVTQFSY
eukprot:SAG31_NODE_816_length_11865_cov_38.805116_13_plen_408_part_00